MIVSDGLVVSGPVEVVAAINARLLTEQPIEVTVTGPEIPAEGDLAIAALLSQYADAQLSRNAPDVASLIELPPGVVA